MTPFRLPLRVQVGCDSFLVVTILGLNLAQLGFGGAATASLEARVTPGDPSPLFAISTTEGSDGSLTLGVTFPSPAGLVAFGASALEQLAPGSSITTTLPDPSATVQDIAALEALATTGLATGSIAFVQSAPGNYFAWSPGDPSTPNGTTIIAGISGNWLLAGTVTIRVSAAAAQAFLGIQVATYDLVVACDDGSSVKLLTGAVLPMQTAS